MEQLKKCILSRTTLARSELSRRLYTKTEWPKSVMGAVIMQVDVSAEASKSYAQEKYGGKFEFDKSPPTTNLFCININGVEWLTSQTP